MDDFEDGTAHGFAVMDLKSEPFHGIGHIGHTLFQIDFPQLAHGNSS